MTTSQESNAQQPQSRPAAPKPSAVIPPRPSVKSPAASSSATISPVAPGQTDHHTDLATARAFAEVQEDGRVLLLDNAEKVLVGQVPGATADEALSYFVKKYDDAYSQALLLKQRLTTDAATSELNKAFHTLQTTVTERQMVGDMEQLREVMGQLKDQLERREATEKQARADALENKRTRLQSIVTDAETIAEQNPESTHWKNSSSTMAKLFDQWKTLQRSGPTVEQAEEEQLWKRFRAARDLFETHRQEFFAQLDDRNAEVKKAKERLITKAEDLSTSTDWANTSAKFRDLMQEWKNTPRASRKLDDALWTRFRAAQDIFFNARQAHNNAIDQEFADNLKLKEQILAEGEKIFPIKDIEKGRAAVNELRGRWEEAGKVPRQDISRMENGFKKIEQQLAEAEEEHWRQTDPATQARANSAVAQLESTITELENELAQARANNNTQAITKTEEALSARRQWLAVLSGTTEAD